MRPVTRSVLVATVIAFTFWAGYRYGWAAGWVHAIEWVGALQPEVKP